MIGRNERKGFLAAHWDWIVAIAAFAVLAGAGAALFLASQEDPVSAAEEERAQGGAVNRPTGVEKVAMASYALARKAVESPAQVPETTDDKESFLSPEKRAFCEQGDPAAEKPACGLPIPFGVKVCPVCGAKQPEEIKASLDSDGDGIPDEDERKLGMDPNDPNDVNADLDGDGFSNLEEYNAKTDPKDKLSHPDYLAFVKIVRPEGEKHLLKDKTLPFVFFDVKPAIDGTPRLRFRDPKRLNEFGALGKMHEAVVGGAIGDTGFKVKSFDKKADKVKVPGTNLLREVDVSTATVERAADGKTAVLKVGDPTHAAIDREASLEYTRSNSLKFAVTAGSTFEIFDTKYTVTGIRREGKAVKVDLSSEKFGNKTLEALEQ